MVEVQTAERAVIAAQHARAAGLREEDALDLASSALHRARAAEPAAEAVGAAADERRDAMRRALRLGRLRAGEPGRRRLREAAGAWGRDPVLGHPVADGRVRHAQIRRDAADREAGFYERAKLLAFDPASGCVAIRRFHLDTNTSSCTGRKNPAQVSLCRISSSTRSRSIARSR